MSTGQISNYAAWLVLPKAATSALQSIYYKIAYGENRGPRPGSSQFIRDRKITYSIVIAVYLTYSVYNSISELRVTNFYNLLNVPLNADTKALKRQFRSLSVLYHPDKESGNEEVFIALKQAYDILTNPVKKFGYDRFGANVISWHDCKTEYDIIVRGFGRSLPHYVVSLFIIIVLHIFQDARGSYWRYYLLISELFLETFLITRSGIQEYLQSYVSFPYRIEDLVSLCRQFTILASIAAAQLGPLLFSDNSLANSRLCEEQQIVMKSMISRISMVGKTLDAEVSRAYLSSMHPFITNTPHKTTKSKSSISEDILESKLQSYLVKQKLRSNSEVQSAFKDATERRHQII
ncbi:hypothetical protein V1511DRAFT_186276 [Dipodascopsis uninucleata]